MIHHVQLACPPGSEDVLRAFYAGVLGLTEQAKPPALAVRGGCWFSAYGIELHLGVEADFRPARKAHPGLIWPDLDGLAARLSAAGYPVRWADPAEIPGMRRFHTEDPHGNRLEFLATITAAPPPAVLKGVGGGRRPPAAVARGSSGMITKVWAGGRIVDQQIRQGGPRRCCSGCSISLGSDRDRRWLTRPGTDSLTGKKVTQVGCWV